MFQCKFRIGVTISEQANGRVPQFVDDEDDEDGPILYRDDVKEEDVPISQSNFEENP